MVEYLRPIAKKHSINRVKASIVMPHTIIRPDDLFQQLKLVTEFSRYQKKTIKKSRTIEFSNLDYVKQAEDEKIIGFIFEEYNDEGLLINYLSIENDQNKSVLTFESRSYTTWNKYFSRFKEDVLFMSKYMAVYVETLSLTYIDEFVWVHPTKIPVEKIFDVKSDLINNKFLKSENGTIIMLSQNTELKSEESTEITFNNRLKRVSINHQYAERLTANNLYLAQFLIEKGSFDDKFNLAHDSNKSMLRNLLSQEVKERIGLK